MSHGQDGHDESPVRDFEAAGWPDMIFECLIKAFNELLERSELGRYFVEVLQSDHLFQCDLMVFVAFGVQEHDG